METDEGYIKEMSQEQCVLAQGDREKHRLHGSDLNPFSTHSARDRWQKGWDGTPWKYDVPGSFYWRAWERGRQARLLKDEGERNQA